MKKLFLLVLCLSLLLSGCGSTETQTANPIQDPQTESPKERVYGINEKVNPEQGITVTVIGISIRDVKGDRTKDNYRDENGEYFAKGSEILKASDYKEIVVDIEFENNTDKVLSVNKIGFNMNLQDGYELLQGLNFSEKQEYQVASHNKTKITLTDIVESSIIVKEVKLTYDYLDYGETWKQAMQEAMSGNLTEEQFKQKINPILLTWELAVE